MATGPGSGGGLGPGGTGPGLGSSFGRSARVRQARQQTVESGGDPASSQRLASIERRRSGYERELVTRGMSPSAARASSRIWAQRQQQFIEQPSPFLSVLGRVFSVPERFETGALRGAQRSFAKGNTNPLAVGLDALEEAARNVKSDRYGFGEILHEDLGVEKHRAGQIGFGLALVFDPTMYIGFGSTSMTRIAARNALAADARKTAIQMDQVLKNSREAGEAVPTWQGEKFYDQEELFYAIHRSQGRPEDLPGAMDKLKAESRKYKRGARRGQEGEGIRRVGATLGGYLLPTAGKGVRGMRFAGMEVPGTGRLGEYLGTKTRAIAAAKVEDRGRLLTRAIGGAFVPRYKQRLIAEDLKRSLALSEMAHLQDDLQRVKIETIEEIASQRAEIAVTGNEGQALAEVAESTGRQWHRMSPEAHIVQAITSIRNPLYRTGKQKFTEEEAIIKLFTDFPGNIPQYKAGIQQWRSEGKAAGLGDPMPKADKIMARAEKISEKANRGKVQHKTARTVSVLDDPDTDPLATDDVGQPLREFLRPTPEELAGGGGGSASWPGGAKGYMAVAYDPRTKRLLISPPGGNHHMLFNAPALREEYFRYEGPMLGEDEMAAAMSDLGNRAWERIDQDFPVQGTVVLDPETGRAIRFNGQIRDVNVEGRWRDIEELGEAGVNLRRRIVKAADDKLIDPQDWAARTSPVPREVTVGKVPLSELDQAQAKAVYQAAQEAADEVGGVPKSWLDEWRLKLEPTDDEVKAGINVVFQPPAGDVGGGVTTREIADLPHDLEMMVRQFGGTTHESSFSFGKQRLEFRFPDQGSADSFAKAAEDRLNQHGVDQLEINKSKLVQGAEDSHVMPTNLAQVLDEVSFRTQPKVQYKEKTVDNLESIPPGGGVDKKLTKKYRAFNDKLAEKLGFMAKIESEADKELDDFHAGFYGYIDKALPKTRPMTARERAQIDLNADPIIPLYHGTYREKFDAMTAESGWLYLTPRRSIAKSYLERVSPLGTEKAEKGRVMEFGLPVQAKIFDARAKFKKPVNRAMVMEAIGRAAKSLGEYNRTDPMQVRFDALREELAAKRAKNYDDVRRMASKFDNEMGLPDDDGLVSMIDEEMAASLKAHDYKGMVYRTPKREVERYRTEHGLTVPTGVPEYAIWDQSVIRRLDEGEHGRIKAEINRRIVNETEEAKAWGISRRESADLWKRLSQTKDDPFEAVGEFVWRQRSKVLTRMFIERIVENPLFAKPLASGWEDQMGAIPAGYKVFTSPERRKYAVLGEMADALEEIKNPVVIDKGTSDFLKLVNMPQNFWKAYATSPNPSFHVMNSLGAVWNNMLGNLYNPGYLSAIAALYRAKIDRATAAGATRRIMGRKPLQTAKTRAAGELVREAEIRGGLGRGTSVFAELTHGEELEKYLEEVPTVRQRIEDLTLRRPGESRKRYTVRQTRRTAGIVAAASGNPLAAVAYAPEIAKGGRKLGSAIEDIVRLAPFTKVSKDPVLRRYLEAYGPILVPGMKHGAFDEIIQTAMYDIGADVSKHFQFDYTDLTDFERRWAKTIFPFYTFYRKNFVLQTKSVIEAPRQFAATMATFNYLNENGDVSDPMRDLLPEYFAQLQAFQVPVPAGVREMLGLPQGDPLYLNPKLPFLSMNLIPPVWDLFRETGQPTKQKVLGVFAPMIGSVGPLAPVPIPGSKPFLEAVTGEMLGLNKTMDYQRAQSNDWRNSWVPAPSWVKYMPQELRDFFGIFPWMETVEVKPGQFMMTATGQYLLESLSTPYVTNLGHSIPVGGPGFEGAKARADGVSWLTGVRLMPVDSLRMHRSWAYRLRSMLESRRQDLRDQGQDLEPEDKKSLRLVRRQLKVLERAWDRRQAELYPEDEK
jgi:hypothetical protein